MNHIITFFSNGSGKAEVFIFSTVLFACWNIENLAGIAGDYRKWSHAVVNAKFVVTGIMPQFIMGLFFIKTMQWTLTHHFGILYYLPHMNHPVVLFITSFILLDF